jgi:asparagine synthase (glutamine-hydrolysing)
VPALEKRLSVSISAMHNRGPDSAGQVSWTARDGHGWSAAIGSTRLAVLDLSPAGRQPMSTPDGRYSLVYNGEITNYVELRDELGRDGVPFSSGSDTEVLLAAWAAWGPDSLRRLEGMYAFAVLDRTAQSLTLCRDPFGIKPLFYRVLPGEGVAFGSEVASILPLLPSRPRLDWATAVSYLSAGAYDDSTATFIDGIRQLGPGRSIAVDLSAGRIQTDLPALWRPSIQTDSSITPDQAADGVRTLLLESVHRNLRADVPVGIALSGGIDSSAIACAVRLLEPDYPLRVFSFVSSDAATDESRWISLVNDQVKAQAWTVTPTAGELAADLDDLLVAQGEPFGSTSIYAQYRVFRLMREAGVVVSLDGQGGDEVFAGYHGYVGQRTRSLIENGDLLGAARFMKNWSRWPGRSLPKGVARAGAEFVPSWAVSAAYRRRPGVVPDGVDMAALRARSLGWDWPAPSAARDGLRGVRVKAELRASLTDRGLQALLRHGDRNSMRFSVESRVPFLDRALVDFVLALPERMLVDESGTTKAVLRAALRGIVPDAVLDRRDKIGFETPETAWIDAQRPSFADLVAMAPDIGFLDKDTIIAGIDPSRPSRRGAVRPMAPRLTWRVFNLYRWASLVGIDAG